MTETRASALPPLRAALLGPVHLAVGERALPVERWPRRSARSLLLLLLAHPTHRLPRDRVLELLWPGAAPGTGSASLRKAVHSLRRVLEPDLLCGRDSAYVEVTGELVGLRDGVTPWIDTEVFERSLANCAVAGGEQRARLRHALALYGGHLLAHELNADWAAGHREALRQARRRAVLTLAELDAEQGEPGRTLPLLESLLLEEPGDEEALRALLRTLTATGQRGEALRRYRLAATALRVEIEAEPSAETRALVEQIRGGPAIRTTEAARPANLPAPPNALVGRRHELATILPLLLRPDVPLVTLTGPGGTGKSRLALEVAAQAAPHFAGGVCFVPLATIRDPGLVLPAIVQALGFEQGIGRSAAEALQGALAERELLLILDNVEQVIEAGPAIAELLGACPRLTILATSREPLRLRAEQLYPTPPLRLPDLKALPSVERLAGIEAVQLFVQRAQAVRPDFALTEDNAAAVAELCARLDGLPLAIELAAARTRGLPTETLLAWMGRRLSLLTDGPRDLPVRLQTMRDAIGWSYDLLTREHQARFRRLAVFAGGFTPEIAWTVVEKDLASQPSGAPQADFPLDALLALVDRSLVRRADRGGEVRFELLETIREFGLEQLVASGEYERIHQAHSIAFRDLAEQANAALDGPDQVVWLDRLEIEQANLRAALRWACDNEERELALRLSSALWRFWIVRGSLVEGRAHLDQALDLPGENALDGYRAAALARAGDLARRCGDLAGASGRFHESLRIWQELGNGFEEASVHTELGCLALARADYPEARRQLGQSLAMQRGADDQPGMARSLLCLARVAHHTGNDDQAARLAEVSLAHFRVTNDRIGIAWALHSLVHYAIDRGELRRARTILGEAMTNAAETGYRWGAIALVEAGAALAAAEDRPERALRLAGAATALREPMGVPLPSDWRGDLDRYLAPARARLGAAAGEIWTAGRSLAIDRAIVEACSPDAG